MKLERDACSPKGTVHIHAYCKRRKAGRFDFSSISLVTTRVRIASTSFGLPPDFAHTCVCTEIVEVLSDRSKLM